MLGGPGAGISPEEWESEAGVVGGPREVASGAGGAWEG